MAKPGGGQEQNMGPNIASVLSLLNATSERMGGEGQEDDKSALAIGLAVTATFNEAMKADVVGNLLGNIDKAATTVGANITPQVSIFSPMRNSLFFGFPVLIDSMQRGGDDGGGGDADDAAGMEGSNGAGAEGDGEDERHLDGTGDPRLYDPWHFDQYPHSDEEIARASHGMDGVSHDEIASGRDMHQELSPSASPDLVHHEHAHSEGRGM
ncbi:MAG: hypothetical protein ACTJLL_03145 [Anaplasma sp.]